MVRALLSLVLSIVAVLRPRRVQLLELAGAGAVVIGLVVWLGPAAGWIAVGIALLGKSLEFEMADSKDAGTSP